MINKRVRESVFFLLIFLLFFLALKMAKFWDKYTSNDTIAYVLVGLVYALVIMAVYYLGDMGNCGVGENFWEITPAARCRGGPYMWQGDSETAKMCREMASTKEGRCMIASYNCPTGYNGVPRDPFYYTPLSDDNWQNARCSPAGDLNTCTAENVATMTSMEKVEPGV